MSADFSVAPEIAQLAAPLVPQPSARSLPVTAGRRAAELARLAARPTDWWDLVRFDPHAPARVPVPAVDGAWLLVIPPGLVTDCECGWATLLAGEAAENGRPLRPGRVLLHGSGRHLVRGSDHGYAVSMHLTGLRLAGRWVRYSLSRSQGSSSRPTPAGPRSGQTGTV